MPSFKCQHGPCGAMLSRRGFCQAHADARTKREADRHRSYETRRDPALRAFYSSRPWANTRTTVLQSRPICESCGRAGSEDVHHREPLRTTQGWARRLEPAGLMAVCRPCHNRLDAAERRKTSR